MPPLKLREQQVLQLMVQGSSADKEIARALNLSPRTIEIYRYNLFFRKLGARNAVDLVRKSLSSHVDDR